MFRDGTGLGEGEGNKGRSSIYTQNSDFISQRAQEPKVGSPWTPKRMISARKDKTDGFTSAEIKALECVGKQYVI
jgi:hypothetical protein